MQLEKLDRCHFSLSVAVCELRNCIVNFWRNWLWKILNFVVVTSILGLFLPASLLGTVRNFKVVGECVSDPIAFIHCPCSSFVRLVVICQLPCVNKICSSSCSAA